MCVFNIDYFEDIDDNHSYIHNLSSRKIQSEKKLGQNSIQTYDLCHTGVLLYQLSHQANLEPISQLLKLLLKKTYNYF